MTKGTYPTMSVIDIITDLNSWGLSINEQYLRQPTPEVVEELYRACLVQITEITMDDIQRPIDDVLSDAGLDSSGKDLYAGPLAYTILVHHLLGIAARVDFSIVDLNFPTRERTINILSGFLNFIKFAAQSCQQYIQEVKERSDHLIVEREQVMRYLEEIRRKIGAIKEKMAADEPRCEQLRRENKELYSKMVSTKEFQRSAATDVDMLKAEKSALLQRKEALNAEIASIEDSVARTRGRIVHSPDRIKRTISKMSADVIEERKTVVAYESKARDLQVRFNALLQIEKDIRNCCDQLRIIEKEVKALDDSHKEVTELSEQLHQKSIDKNELVMRHERVKKQLANATEKAERAQHHASEKKASSQRTIQRLEQEYAEMSTERRDNDKEVEKLRTEADAIESQMVEHMKKSESELNLLLTEYWKLRHETDIYMETLAEKLNFKVITEKN